MIPEGTLVRVKPGWHETGQIGLVFHRHKEVACRSTRPYVLKFLDPGFNAICDIFNANSLEVLSYKLTKLEKVIYGV